MPNDLGNHWVIEFTKNVHMYSHSLKAMKYGWIHNVPCEDTPDGFIGIWPYELNLDSIEYQALLGALRDWANHVGIKYRLYETPDVFETNDSKY